MLRSTSQKSASRRTPLRTCLFVTLLLTIASGLAAYAYRKPLLHWGLSRYLESKGLRAQFSLEIANWDEVLITDINIENGIYLPKFHILRQASSSQIGPPISAVNIEVESIDVWTTKKVIEQWTADNAASEKQPLQFADYQKYCRWLQPADIRIQLKKLIHENTEIPLNMKLEHAPGATNTFFSFAGKNLKYNSNPRFQLTAGDYSGRMELDCGTEAIRLFGDPVIISIAHLYSTEPQLTLKDSKIISEKMEFSLFPDNRANLHFPLQFKVMAKTGTQKIVADIPRLLITADHSLDGAKKSSVLVSAKNIKMTSPYGISVTDTRMELTTPYNWFESIDGSIRLKDITYSDSQGKPLLKDMTAKIQLQRNGTSSNAVIDLSDKTQTIAIEKVQVLQTGAVITAEFKKNKTRILLNKKMNDLMPLLKEHIHSATGTLSFEGLISYKNKALTGNIQLMGSDISLQSAYGAFSKINIDHDIVDLETLASSPRRKITIQQFIAGKEIDNISLHYQVLNRSRIFAHKLHLEHESGEMEAHNFTIDPLQKVLKDFKARIQKLPLGTFFNLIALPGAQASGTLTGQIDLDYEDKQPVISGALKSEQEGWIRYRNAGQAQKKTISLSDSPIDILNNYLYNFEYKDLDLQLKSDKNFNFNAHLNTFGRNPDYLSGKPLKLKINLEQNILTAIQSMLLTYNLPSKLQEKIEKAVNEP